MWERRSVEVYELARDFMAQAHRTGDPRAVDEAVLCLRDLLDTAPTGDPARWRYLADLGVALRWRYEQTGNPTDLVAALEAGAEAVRATPWYEPARFDNYNSLINALWARYMWSDDLKHLNEGIDVAQAAAAKAPLGHPVRPRILSGLGSALRARYHRTGDLADLDAAIRAGAQAADACPDDPDILSDLLTTLQASPPVEQELDSLLRALHWVVYSTPRDHPDQPENLYNLAEGLERRFKKAGSLADLDDLIRITGRAVAMDPRSPWLTALGGWLLERFQRTRDLPHLDDAIRVSFEAVQATDPHDPNHTLALVNLGTMLRLRFEHTGALADLDEAIRFSAAALQVTTPDRPIVLSSLGTALVLRYGRTRSAADLKEAVRLHTEAAQTIASDAGERPDILTALSLALELRFARTAATADIDEAVRVGVEAASLAAEDHLSRPVVLANLAGTLRRRHGHTGGGADLDQSVAVASEAVSLTPPEHPEHARRLFVLGYSLAYRYIETDRVDDCTRAAQAFADVQRAVGVAPSVRTDAAKYLGGLNAITRNWPGAVYCYDIAVRWLPVVASRVLTRDAQEHRLGVLEGLACDAAACALANGDAAQAAELLEAGRGVLLSQALATRTDVTDLRVAAPELAERYEFLRRALERNRELADEFDALVTEIRRLPGFEGFLTPVPAADLAAEAGEGPIVWLNVSEFRCDALVLTAQGVRVVGLAVTKEVVRERARNFLAALETGHRDTAKDAERQQAQETIAGQLEWLWDTIAEPVLTALGHTGQPGGKWPRIWWSPTGSLVFLPLHAAGYHRDQSRRSVLDRVVSSYTPTAGNLRHHRARAMPAPSALVVALPQTPHAPELPGAQQEHDLLTRTFAGVTTIVGADATHERVLAELPRHTVAHFACHGLSDPANPSRSRVLLHDHADNPLTVRDIARLDLTAELAYLSACDTARTTARLADEAIHLAGAFQLAGYANVIATLWTIMDPVALSIAEDFYAHFAGSRNAALALHDTIRRARDRYPKRPSFWAAHVHSGI
jgi:CHAT domain-containing protein